MYLFDKKERIKDVAERGSLPLYDFFDKYNNDKHNKIRDFLNKSFSQYNEENQKRIYDEIIKNKSSDEKFYSTCFELIIYYLFREFGYTLEPHPSINNVATKPDFLVTVDNGKKFYLELVTVGESDQEDIQIKRLEGFLAKFENHIDKNHIDNTKYCIRINKLYGRGISHDMIEDIKSLVKKWWDYSKKTLGTRFPYSKNGVNLEFEICKMDDKAHIQALMRETRIHDKLLDSLNKKADKYGKNLDFPYVIATTFRPSLSLDYLYSCPTIIPTTLYGGNILNKNKKTNYFEGLWNTFKKQKNNHVNAILFFDSLIPEKMLEKFYYNLFINKYATHNLPDSLMEKLPYYYVVNKQEARQSDKVDPRTFLAVGRF